MENRAALYPFQIDAVERALAAPHRRWIFNFEPGLGKTATAIETMKRANCYRILVVCPAIVRESWRREFLKWWPDKVDDVGVIDVGRLRSGLSKRAIVERERAYACPIKIVSYDLLREVVDMSVDAIVFDELHYLSSPSSQQAKLAREVSFVPQNRDSMILGLTGTLIPNDICNVWNQLNTIWPGRFGQADKTYKYGSWHFACRYSNKIINEYGTKFAGANSSHIDELKRRLSRVSSRATKAAVAKFLPAFNVSSQYYRPTKINHSVEAAIDWATNAIASGSQRIVMFTHLKDTARKLWLASRDLTMATWHIDGTMAAKERLETIDLWQRESQTRPAIIVATMHSVGIGINGLEAAQQAAFVELYARPATILQAMGRFNRLSSTEPASLTFLVAQGTHEERIVDVLTTKIAGINQSIAAGAVEQKLESAFAIEDEQAFLSDLLATISKGRAVDSAENFDLLYCDE